MKRYRIPCQEKAEKMDVDLMGVYCTECRSFTACEHLDMNGIGVRNTGMKMIQSLLEYGYMIIQVDLGQVTELEAALTCLFKESSLFFLLPEEDKIACCSKDRARRGYSPNGTDNFASLIGKKGHNDKVEKFRIGPEISDEQKSADLEYYQSKQGKVHFFANDWTNVPSNYRNALVNYYQCVHSIALALMTVLREFFETIPRFSDCSKSSNVLHQFDRHTSILSINHYPLLFPACDIVRVEEHTDVSLFTIVSEGCTNRETTRLQLLNKDNLWEDVMLQPGQFLVNAGDYLNYISNYQIRSVRHRVVSSQHGYKAVEESMENGRCSAAYFFAPNYDAIITCRTDIVQEFQATHEPPLYIPGLNYDTWRKHRIARAMDLLKKSK